MEIEAVTATRRLLRAESEGTPGTPLVDGDLVGLHVVHRASPTHFARSVAGAAAAHEEHLDDVLGE